MLKVVRSDVTNPDFRALVQLLDQYLKIVDGDDHAFYNQYNQLDSVKYALVAYMDGEPVGCGAIKNVAEGVMEVKRMFVLPTHRGQGVAQAVLSGLEQWADELGGTTLILETGKKQTAAVRLYEKAGFTVIPNYGQYVGVETSVCMQKLVSLSAT